jgi:hypothetical protein
MSGQARNLDPVPFGGCTCRTSCGFEERLGGRRWTSFSWKADKGLDGKEQPL